VTSDNGSHSIVVSPASLHVGGDTYLFSMGMRENISFPRRAKEWFLQISSERYIPEFSGLYLLFYNNTSCYLPRLEKHRSEKDRYSKDISDISDKVKKGKKERYTVTFYLDDDILVRIQDYGISKLRINTQNNTVEDGSCMNNLGDYLLKARDRILKRTGEK